MAGPLQLLLLVLGATHAGFVSPGHSLYLGSSPTLQYLVHCGYIQRKPPTLSTYDIYTLAQLTQGVRNLQAAMGVKVTGQESRQERKMIQSGQCQPDTRSPHSSVEFLPPSSSVEFPSASPSAPYVKLSKPMKKPVVPKKKPFLRPWNPSTPQWNPSSRRTNPSQAEWNPPPQRNNPFQAKGCRARLLPVSPCSRSYLSCWAGNTRAINCPAGTVFSATGGICTWATLVPDCET